MNQKNKKRNLITIKAVMQNAEILNSTREVLLQLFDNPYIEIQKDTSISRQTVSKYFRIAGSPKVSTSNILFSSAVKLIKEEVAKRDFLDRDIQEKIKSIFTKTSNDLKETN